MEKIWLKQYPKGVPSDIHPEQYQSLSEVFDECCAKYPDRPAFYSLGTTLTFREVEETSRALAAWFQEALHLKKGDRIALMLPNILQYPVAMFAAIRAGLVVVNVNPLYTSVELSHQMKDSGTETIIVMSSFAATVQQALPFTSLKNVIITELGDLLSRPKAFLLGFFLRYIRKAIPAYKIPGIYRFRKILRSGRRRTFKSVILTPKDIAFLQYTGGTTGVSKGAVLTHYNMIANVMQAEAWFSPILKPGQEIIITALPLYHIFSLTANCLFISKIGGLNLLIVNPRDLNGMIKEIARFPFTAITGVNTLFSALLKHPKFASVDFSALKLSLGGGMAVQRVVAELWKKVTNVPLLEAYGLTEASPCVSANPTTLVDYNGTVGLPFPSTEVCVLDEDHREVPPGEVGELAVKGPQVMMEYWNNPGETQKVFGRDHWLLTGDVVSIDTEGYIRIRERKKDMILVSGFNVYPNEIEDVLVRISGIREAAVVGVPDEHSGEAVKAFIVRERPDLNEAEIIRFCHQNLTGYKVPKYIEFCLELPKSNVGKILRRALRASVRA